MTSRLASTHSPQHLAHVGGQRYLTYSQRARELWEEDTPGNIVKGTRNWPGVLGR